MKYLIILISLFISIACDSHSTQPIERNDCSHIRSNDFLPLIFGANWEYDYFIFDDGNISHQEIRIYSVVDTSTFTINDQKNAVSGVSLKSSYNNYAESDFIKYYHKKSDGIYQAGFIFESNQVMIRPEMLYKFPVNVGENWQVRNLSINSTQDSLVILSTTTYRCVAKNELFVTLLDTFETVVYGHSSKQAPDILSYWHYFEYFSPGIGKVGLEIYSSLDSILTFEDRLNLGVKMFYQLTDYCISSK